MAVLTETWPLGNGTVLERRSQAAANPIPNIVASTDPYCQQQLYATVGFSGTPAMTGSQRGVHDSGLGESFDSWISENSVSNDANAVLIPCYAQGANTYRRIRKFLTSKDDNLPAFTIPAGGAGLTSYVASYSIRKA